LGTHLGTYLSSVPIDLEVIFNIKKTKKLLKD